MLTVTCVGYGRDFQRRPRSYRESDNMKWSRKETDQLMVEPRTPRPIAMQQIDAVCAENW
jgi:hypothetical protein